MIKQTLTIIRKNFSYLLIAETLIRLMTLVLTIFIARVYGTEKFGIYALALSVGNLFEILFNLGLGTVFIQRVSANLSDIPRQLGIFLPLRLILSFISFACFVVFAFLLSKNTETLISLLLAGLYYSLFSIETFLAYCFDAKQKMHFTAGIKLFKYVLIFLLAAYFVYVREPIHYIFFAYLIASFLAIFSSLVFIVKYFARFRPTINFSEWKAILSEGWPITLSATFVYIYNYLDTIIISVIKGESAVGLYQAGYKIVGTIFLFAALLNQAYLPALAKIFSSKSDVKNQISMVFSRAIKSVFFWSIPITFGGLILAERIIVYIFGTDYLGSVNAFKILIFNCIIYFFSTAMTNLLYADKKQKSTMLIFFLGAAANVIFNIFMIPLYGIEGAAITTAIAEIIVMIGIYVLAKKIAPIKIFTNLWRALLAGTCMSLLLYYVFMESLILTIGFGGIIYLAVYYLINRIFPQKKLPPQEPHGSKINYTLEDTL